jgi:hypothetical protein
MQVSETALGAVKEALARQRSPWPTSSFQGYLIAFAGKPANKSFLDTLVQMAKNDGVDILGAIVTPGPGCHNLAILLNPPNEAFVNALTMALMPAKWCTTTDPKLKLGEFIDEVEHN